jgi:hypothetical protein
MFFQNFAQSAWVLPLLPWLATPIVVAYALRQRGFLRVWGIACALLIAADAFTNGAWTPVPPHTSWATFFGVTFVILGDFRYFLLVEQARTPNRPPLAVLASAGALAFVVPLAAQLFRATTSIAGDLRTTYLTYEALFLGFLLVYGFALGRRRSPLERRLFGFELAQYGAWATIDVLLLVTKADSLYLARVVPDVLYYVVFVPFALRASAGDSSRASEVEGAHAP